MWICNKNVYWFLQLIVGCADEFHVNEGQEEPMMRSTLLIEQ